MTIMKPLQRLPHMSCAQLTTRLAFLSLVLFLLFTHDELSCSNNFPYSSKGNNGNDWLILPQHDPHLASLLKVSAFDNSLYDAFHHPYNDYSCQPRKIHLSQGTNVDPDSGVVNMTLSFSLNRTQCGGSHQTPSSSFPTASSSNLHMVVVYGRGIFPDGRIEQRAADSEHSVHFDFTSPVTGELYQSDWIQHVTLPNLIGGSHLYWYRISIVQQQSRHLPQLHLPPSFRPVFLRGSLYKVGETPTYRFRTPPLYHQPTSLALVGDLGQTENSTKTMNRILQAALLDQKMTPIYDNMPPPVTQVLIAGDLSYADGVPERWDSWLELMQPLLQTLPLSSVPGNHEIECDNITHNVFVPYETQFRNPNRIADPDMEAPSDTYIDTLWHRMCNTPSQFLGHYNFGNAFYQYQHGMVHIIALNSYTSILPGSIQYNWLAQVALPSVNRDDTPWLLVMFHCPLYTTFLGHNDEINPTLMKSSIEDLLKKHRVNMVISGHDHAYLRTHPLNHDKIDSTGQSPMYWTLGAGGNREQHTKGYIYETPEVWVAKRDNDEYGYGHFFAKNKTHAHLHWVRDGTSSEIVRDAVWIENNYFVNNSTN